MTQQINNPNGSTTLMPAPTQVDHLQRFDQIFSLEQELVGATYKKKSEKGAVRVGVLTMKDLKAVTGIEGKDELKMHRRHMTDKLKEQAGQLVTRLMSDPRFTGRTIALNAKGNVLTIAFEKVEPLNVMKMTPEELQKAAVENLTVEQLEQAISQLKALDAANKAAANTAKPAEAPKAPEQKAITNATEAPKAPAANQPAAQPKK